MKGPSPPVGGRIKHTNLKKPRTISLIFHVDSILQPAVIERIGHIKMRMLCFHYVQDGSKSVSAIPSVMSGQAKVLSQKKINIFLHFERNKDKDHIKS